MRILSCLILIVLFNACSKQEKESYKNVNSSQILASNHYVGSVSCKECHADAYKSWQGSHHQQAMQIADSTTVLGDFNNKQVKIDGVNYHFFTEENSYKVRIEEIDKSIQTYVIKYTFGVHPLQQYLIDFEGGKKQVLRASWDVLKKQWFHQYNGQTIEPTDWLHWTRGAQNWNTMCAECHSTNLKKQYQVETDTYNTTYDEINVSCESCHGPGQSHINWVNQNGEGKGKDPILKGASQQDQLNLCATCHSRRAKLTENYEPGTHFSDQYLIQNINDAYYYPDGQIDEEDYVYGSFKQSKMYANGVKCNDCHNVHTLKLKAKGNDLCMQCHEPQYNTKSHHFHQEQTEQSSCVSCHMTGKIYMGNDFRRDHSFRVPRPDQSIESGTPNACTECHKNKSDAWAANQIKQWYGSERVAHFSDYLITSQKEGISEQEQVSLTKFINNLDYPAISRSSVIENLAINSNQDFEAILKALKDPSPEVRFHALRKLRLAPLENRISIALTHAQDSSKLVRIGAGELTIGMEQLQLTPTELATLQQARLAYEKMLFANADFSSGRMQLGDYFLQNNNLNLAIKHYNKALEKDSLLLPVYTNLATAYSINGNNAKAEETLLIWMRLDPDNDRPYYLRALLKFELGDANAAIKDLEQCIKMNPRNSRAMYNLATFYLQQKQLKKAQVYANKAIKLEPLNNEFQQLLQAINQQL